MHLYFRSMLKIGILSLGLIFMFGSTAQAGSGAQCDADKWQQLAYTDSHSSTKSEKGSVKSEKKAEATTTKKEAAPAHMSGHSSGSSGHSSGSSGHAAASSGHSSASSGHESAPALTADQAMKRLMEGNLRYVTGKTIGPNRGKERREEVAKGQKPFAIILGCADSRVSPEIMFDRGVGDLFVVRTAGNVADPVVLGSIEYAVEHLGTRLIMVMGHERCGAVAATVAGGPVSDNIKAIVDRISPAVEKSRSKHGDLTDNSIRANVKMVVEQLKTSPVLSEFFDDGLLKAVGGYYDLDTGAVELVYNPCMSTF